ncbi:hypothetical protein NOF55_19990 [Rhizobiaceae bacterium BDR2-2]|uniref:Uncharacterized protein n=1 Tax=Ectorhizobium quercum TaxID=2965071 RepID=A0AAE3N6F0_9HYPH|nr:hypothetical protein [Ectorhizobium quercum]MCX8999392.1 hypothetical protein [Ectorhizobium quercum]
MTDLSTQGTFQQRIGWSPRRSSGIAPLPASRRRFSCNPAARMISKAGTFIPPLIAATVMVIACGSGPAGAGAGWVGEWQSGPEKAIAISAGPQPGGLLIEGNATFGTTDPERTSRGSVNTGSFSVVWPGVREDDRQIAFTIADDRAIDYASGETYDCRLRLTLGGGHLDVEDNNQCGGFNVTFTGRYARTEP